MLLSGRYLPQAEVLAAVQSAHVGVIPNLSSRLNRFALSSKMFEYVALGVPVVSADLPTIREHFSDEEVLFFRPVTSVHSPRLCARSRGIRRLHARAPTPRCTGTRRATTGARTRDAMRLFSKASRAATGLDRREPRAHRPEPRARFEADATIDDRGIRVDRVLRPLSNPVPPGYAGRDAGSRRCPVATRCARVDRFGSRPATEIHPFSTGPASPPERTRTGSHPTASPHLLGSIRIHCRVLPEHVVATWLADYRETGAPPKPFSTSAALRSRPYGGTTTAASSSPSIRLRSFRATGARSTAWQPETVRAAA